MYLVCCFSSCQTRRLKMDHQLNSCIADHSELLILKSNVGHPWAKDLSVLLQICINFGLNDSTIPRILRIPKLSPVIFATVPCTGTSAKARAIPVVTNIFKSFTNGCSISSIPYFLASYAWNKKHQINFH